MTAKIELDWPEPPSVNRVWRGTVKKGRLVVHRSTPYQKWIKEAWVEWLQQRPKDFMRIDGAYRAVIIISPSRKGRDLGNYEKAIQDAAQNFGIVKNDSNCRKLTMWFGTPDEAPRGCRLILEKIS